MAYSQMWEIEVRHDGLKKYRHIRGSDRYVVEQKALAQRLAWDEMWAKRVSVEEAKNSKLEFYRTKFNKAETAITKTKEAEESIKSFEGARSNLKCNLFRRKMLHGKIQTIKS